MAIYVPAYDIIHLIHVHCFDGTQNKLHRYLDFFLILDFFNFITFMNSIGHQNSEPYLYNYNLQNKWAKITGFLLKITCFHFSRVNFRQVLFLSFKKIGAAWTYPIRYHTFAVKMKSLRKHSVPITIYSRLIIVIKILHCKHSLAAKRCHRQ